MPCHYYLENEKTDKQNVHSRLALAENWFNIMKYYNCAKLSIHDSHSPR